MAITKGSGLEDWGRRKSRVLNEIMGQISTSLGKWLDGTSSYKRIITVNCVAGDGVVGSGGEGRRI